MKTTLRNLPLLSLFAVASVGLGPTLVGARDIDAGATAPRVTTKDEYRDHGWDKLRGADVRAADGKHLGDIRDLVLDPRSGEIRFAIVSGGGMAGLGGNRRLLPFSALIREPKEKGFITRLQQVDWDLLPTLDKADLRENRIVLTSDQRRNLDRLGNQEWAHSFSSLTDNDAANRRYVLASGLAGKPLYGENEKVGKVDDLFVDANGAAMAVVDIDRDYVPANGREFLVPISALEAAVGEHGRVHTTLTAAQFDQAIGITPEPADRDAGPWAKYRKHDRHASLDTRRDAAVEVRRDDSVEVRRDAPVEVRREVAVERTHADVAPSTSVNTPAPTGLPSGYSDGSVGSAAQAIRDSWANDAALRPYNLRADVSGGIILLSGSLPTTRLAQRAEDTARRVTSNVTIDNRIHVDER